MIIELKRAVAVLAMVVSFFICPGLAWADEDHDDSDRRPTSHAHAGHEHGTTVSLLLGMGAEFRGGLRRGGGLFAGWAPLAAELHVEIAEGWEFALGAHLVWAGGQEVDIGLHPGVMKEWCSSGGGACFAFGPILSIAALHEESGWGLGLGGGLGSHLTFWNRFAIGADVQIIGAYQDKRWAPQWSAVPTVYYRF